MLMNSGIALPRAGLPPGTVPQPRVPRLRATELGTWFEATCPFGSVRLCVEPASDTASHAAAAALLLHRAEALLAALDDWIGLDLDWDWSAAAGAPPAASLATAQWAAGDGPACALSMPWPLLRALPAPPVALEWPLVPAELALERLALALDELAEIEPGGALLLPGSMQAPWIGRLRAVGESASGVAIDLSDPSRPRLADRDASVAQADDPQRIACELRLDLPLGVHATRLAGWRREGDAGELVRLAGHALRATLWRLPSARHAEHAVASGSLMPWGDGWALAIETLADTPERGADTKV